jgi:hypothetical protein
VELQHNDCVEEFVQESIDALKANRRKSIELTIESRTRLHLALAEKAALIEHESSKERAPRSSPWVVDCEKGITDPAVERGKNRKRLQ